MPQEHRGSERVQVRAQQLLQCSTCLRLVRSTWTADASQPGYGNFCFGHREVSSVDSFTPPDADATQYTVNYHDTVTGLPDWASSAEMNTAFPKIAALTSGQQTATATLVKSSSGWQVTNVTPPPDSNHSNSNGLVQ